MIDWFRHDTDARNDIKIRRLLRDSSVASLGAYWICVELLYQQGGYAEKDSLIEELSFYDSEDCLEDLLSHGLIEDVGNGIVTSQRVLSEIKFQDERRQKKVEAGRKGGLSTQAKSSATKAESSNAQAMLKQHSSNAKAFSSTIQDKTKQINISDSSKDSSLGEHCECPPVEEAGKTDLFGQKIEEERERVPVQKVVDYWNKAVKDTPLPQIRQPNESRKTLIRQRWAEYKNDVYEAIDRTVSSDFLTGRDGKWSRCCFDWVFKKENMTKILEGNYDNKKEAIRRHKDYSDIKDEDLEKEFHWT